MLKMSGDYEMFVGAINQEMRSILAETAKLWRDKEIYIGCSGNFTVERVLASIGIKNIHSNDVSLYSCALGKYLAGEPFNIHVKDERLLWLEKYLTPGIQTISTLLLCTQLFSFLDRTEPYHKRMLKAYMENWRELHQKTMERVEKSIKGIKIKEFYAGDVIDFIRNAPKDAVVISFPPTYKGGYERLYKKFDEVFEWEKPDYKVFDEDSFKEFMGLIINRESWMTLRDKEEIEWSEYLKGVVQTSIRSKPVYIYAKDGKAKLALTRQRTEKLLIPRLEGDIKGPLNIIKISQPQMNLLRSEYLSLHIIPASAFINLAVVANGQLIGAMAFNKSSYSRSTGDVYLLSDFAIRPTKYKRLSKLILVAALSTEVKDILEQSMNTIVKKIYTTAFTEKAVSMKYRGLFDIYNRKDGMINYMADADRWTLKEGFEWWTNKYGQILNP